MVYIETYYDYEIDKEVYKVCEEKGYTKSTDITLTPLTLSTSSINNAVQTFQVNVLGDRGNSTVAFYDNGTIIPVTVNGNQVNFIDWDTNKQQATVTINLNYGIEHNIQAKYKGNSKCLASSSKEIPLFIDYPPAYATTIVLTPSIASKVYRKNQNVVINGTLKDKNNTNLGSKTIKIYVDNSLASTVTTNSSGAFLYTNSTLDNGEHTIKAVFEGTVQYFETQSSITVSKGYEVQIDDYSKFWIDGKGSITCTVLDYFGQTIPGVNVSSNIGGTTISGTTDSEGKCTLTKTTNSNSLSAVQVKTTYNDVSETINLNHIHLSTISLTGDTICAIRQTAQLNISATADGNKSLEGLPVVINNPNIARQTVYLDANNTAINQYNGVGQGDITLTAEFGDANNTTTHDIEDLAQYWKAGYNEWNMNYTLNQAELLTQSNGYKLVSALHSTKSEMYISIVGDWQVEFDIVSIYSQVRTGDTLAPLICGVSGNKFKANDHVLITRKNNVRTVSVKSQGSDSYVVVSTYSGSAYASPHFLVHNGNVKGNLLINDVKVKVI